MAAAPLSVCVPPTLLLPPVHRVEEAPTTWQLVGKIIVQIWGYFLEGLRCLRNYWDKSSTKGMCMEFFVFRTLAFVWSRGAEKVEICWGYFNRILLAMENDQLREALQGAQRLSGEILQHYQEKMQNPAHQRAITDSEQALQQQCQALRTQLALIEQSFRRIQEGRLKECLQALLVNSSNAQPLLEACNNLADIQVAIRRASSGLRPNSALAGLLELERVQIAVLLEYMRPAMAPAPSGVAVAAVEAP